MAARARTVTKASQDYELSDTPPLNRPIGPGSFYDPVVERLEGREPLRLGWHVLLLFSTCDTRFMNTPDTKGPWFSFLHQSPTTANSHRKPGDLPGHATWPPQYTRRLVSPFCLSQGFIYTHTHIYIYILRHPIVHFHRGSKRWRVSGRSAGVLRRMMLIDTTSSSHVSRPLM